MDKQKTQLKNYLLIAHHVNPTLVLWFVFCYWLAGMLHYYMAGFGIVLTILVMITIIFVVAFVAYFWCWKKIKKDKK